MWARLGPEDKKHQFPFTSCKQGLVLKAPLPTPPPPFTSEARLSLVNKDSNPHPFTSFKLGLALKTKTAIPTPFTSFKQGSVPTPFTSFKQGSVPTPFTSFKQGSAWRQRQWFPFTPCKQSLSLDTKTSLPHASMILAWRQKHLYLKQAWRQKHLYLM